MPEIESARRRIPKLTYVPLKVDTATSETGASVVKFGYMRNLALQLGEVDVARKQFSSSVGRQKQASLLSTSSALWRTLKKFEGTPMPSELPHPGAFAKIPTATLLAFGKVVLELRQQALSQMKNAPPSTLASDGARPTVTPMALDSANIGKAMNAVNSGIIANKSFEANVSATPIGMLNLERLEMTPAGIERGELLATIPLAPKEETAVVQKEWSVTTKEFTSIVTDSLENYSETGVTENTELAQSTNSQIQHSNQFNINATVSGGCGFVTGTVTTAFGTQDSSSASAAESRKHAVQTTRKASSRVKQEHKMSISTTTVTGTSETTTRTLVNPSDTNSMRIDYFSMMRKWRVRLYRYGLRMTYDVAIPEPGGTLREAYKLLDDLQKQLALSFNDVFKVTYGDINEQSYLQLGSDYGAQVPPPPTEQVVVVGGPVPGLGDDDIWHFYQTPPVSVPDGYWITDVYVNAMVGIAPNHNHDGNHHFVVIGSRYDKTDQNNWGYNDDLTVPQYGNFMQHFTGSQAISCFFQWANSALVQFTIKMNATAATYEQWIATVWNALYNAAQNTFYAKQQTLNAQIQALQDQISGVDTLTLRREESDEIMKGVLRWLLGTGFDFMPPNVVNLFGGDLTHGVSFTGNEPGLDSTGWTTMFNYEEMVKFINEAIEWENVIYFLYSYFWDVPESWDFIRQIKHPDSTRQAFLRAGSARIVLTVRKGYEQAWMSFVELGDFGQILPPGHPYMTIAQEIQAYDDKNYPGIPPANPGRTSAGLADAVVTASAAKVSANAGPVTLVVDSSVGMVVGNQVIIDTLESGLQEVQKITAVPDPTHITVQPLTNAHNGTSMEFPVIQPGESGVLIGEWYEYTPTSGTDIAVTSNLATIA